MSETNPEVQQGGTVEKTEVTPEVGEKGQEHLIPKSRFDEVNAKYKEMAAKMAEIEKADTERKQAEEQAALEAKKEQGKFEELYQNALKELDVLKQTQSRATELETVINSMVQTKLEAIPEEMQDLVPANLTAEATLDWLNKAESKGLFAKPEVKEIGKMSNKGNEGPKIDNANISAFDKILAGLGK
jgi:hypothetical protein